MEGEHKAEGRIIDLTLPRLWKIWWALVWRGILIGYGGAFIIGLFVGFFWAILGGEKGGSYWYAFAAGFLWSFPAGLITVKLGLKARFSDFEICLLSTSDVKPSSKGGSDEPQQ